MKRVLAALFTVMLAVTLLLGGAVTGEAAQNLPQITIVNKTGYTFYYLYVSPTASEVWGRDVLGSGVLRSGYEMVVTLPYPINVTNTYDIKAVDVDGDSYTKWNVTVRPNSRIEFVFADIDPRRQ